MKIGVHVVKWNNLIFSPYKLKSLRVVWVQENHVVNWNTISGSRSPRHLQNSQSPIIRWEILIEGQLTWSTAELSEIWSCQGNETKCNVFWMTTLFLNYFELRRSGLANKLKQDQAKPSAFKSPLRIFGHVCPRQENWAKWNHAFEPLYHFKW